MPIVVALAAGAIAVVVFGIFKTMRKEWTAVETEAPRPEDAITPVGAVPSWLLSRAAEDADELRASIHQLDYDTQNGHTFIHWDGSKEYHQPFVTFTFGYVNASVYTILAEFWRGNLAANHQPLTGNFDINPFEIQRNRHFTLSLRFVITSDASMAYLRAQAKEGAIYFSMDDFRLALKAKEDSTVKQSELFISPQYWRKNRD